MFESNVSRMILGVVGLLVFMIVVYTIWSGEGIMTTLKQIVQISKTRIPGL